LRSDHAPGRMHNRTHNGEASELISLICGIKLKYLQHIEVLLEISTEGFHWRYDGG